MEWFVRKSGWPTRTCEDDKEELRLCYINHMPAWIRNLQQFDFIIMLCALCGPHPSQWTSWAFMFSLVSALLLTPALHMTSHISLPFEIQHQEIYKRKFEFWYKDIVWNLQMIRRGEKEEEEEEEEKEEEEKEEEEEEKEKEEKQDRTALLQMDHKRRVTWGLHSSAQLFTNVAATCLVVNHMASDNPIFICALAGLVSLVAYLPRVFA
jgi:hypothetical protein